jgi:uncharacterized protein YdiU (UPF0061 family)
MTTDRSEAGNTPIGWNFDNSYTLLSPQLYAVVEPSPATAPRLMLLNPSLAEALGLDITAQNTNLLTQQLAGNSLPQGSMPIAQAYMGHQFGYLNMLGDGRALLLGEHLAPNGQRYDVQLKGSGATPYSRRGDGRATLSAMLREYVISEAMHHLGIPTSRSLAVVATGMPVYREQLHQGAVLTRIMQSHIRVGTFEYATRHLTPEAFKHFVTYVLQRHYPTRAAAANPALALLEEVIEAQAKLITEWMRVGFIHGVMNTDNMSIGGETFDYGPCAFMNAYSPATVYSSIDTQGRYAFGNQPAIAQWNLAVLAGTLVPLLHTDEKEAVALAKAAIQHFPDLYESLWLRMMQRKLGYTEAQPNDKAEIEQLLALMEQNGVDYTNFFTQLRLQPGAVQGLYEDQALADWIGRRQLRIQAQPGGTTAADQLMQAANPVYIARNHRVEEALEMATMAQDMQPLHKLLEVLAQPYATQPGYEAYMEPPAAETGYKTFCNT